MSSHAPPAAPLDSSHPNYWGQTSVRWAIIAFAGLALALAAFAAVQTWRVDRAQDAERDNHIETRERIDNALDHPADCAWPDRLLGNCLD